MCSYENTCSSVCAVQGVNEKAAADNFWWFPSAASSLTCISFHNKSKVY